MSGIERIDPDKLAEVDEVLGQMGFDFGDAIIDPRVSAYADGLHRVLSEPDNMPAVNDTVRAHEGLGFLLPGWFKVDADDIKLTDKEELTDGDSN